MFIIFITLIAASLAAVSAHLYTALTLSGQTIEYAIQAVRLEQYTQGVLAYAIAHIARQEKEKVAMCDIFNNSQDGFVQGIISYTNAPDGYLIEVRMSRLGQSVGGVRARIVRESTPEKVLYSCVALDAF